MRLPRFELKFTRDGATPLAAPDDVGLVPDVSSLRAFAASFAGASFSGGIYRTFAVAEMKKWTNTIEEGFPKYTNRIACFGFDWMGRLFALDTGRRHRSEVAVTMFDVSTGDAFEIPASLVSFHEQELVDHAHDAVAAPYFEKWRGTGGSSPTSSQCVGYKKPLFLGGTDEIANLELADMDVYWTLGTQMLTQVRGLPKGTPIGAVTLSRSMESVPWKWERGKHAMDAAVAFAWRTSVVVSPKGELDTLGSGVLVRDGTGPPFVVTAKHLVRKGWGPFRVAHQAGSFLDAADAVYLGPAGNSSRDEDGVNVAVALLTGAAATALAPFACDISCLATSSAIVQSDQIAMCGYPTAYGFEQPGHLMNMPNMFYLTRANGTDDLGRIRVAWDEAICEGMASLGEPPGTSPYQEIEVGSAKAFQLRHPGGISGGALWRFRGVPAGELWHAERAGELIGIPVSFIRSGTEFCEPVELWRDWLLEAVRGHRSGTTV